MNKTRIILYVVLTLITFVSCKENNQTGQTSNKKNIKVSANTTTSNLVKIDTQYVNNAPTSISRTIIQDRKGDIWMATFLGVFRYDGKTFSNVTKGISSARFFSLLEDRQGNLWFGSIGSGVYRYNGKSFQNFTTKDGLLNNEVGSIYEDKSGNLWFGVSGGASRYDGKSFRNYIINEEIMKENRTGKTFSERQPYEVNTIIEDKTGKIWIGTRGNCFVYDGENFNSVSHSGKPFKNVRTMIEDKEGYIWLGGNDGLWRYDSLIYTNVIKDFVGYIYQDRNGNIWTSSQSDKDSWVLSRYEDKSLHSENLIVTEIDPKAGMIFGILEDDEGNIWAGTLKGVFRYDGKDLKYFRNKKE